MKTNIEEQRKHEADSVMQNADQVKGAIQIEQYAGADFSIDNNFEIDKLLFDTLLIHFEDGDSSHKNVGGILVPTEAIQKKVWRHGKVILAGERCRTIKAGDYVIFPNDKGINTKSIRVEGHGILKDCTFLAEDRCFARCKKADLQ